jgi:hypothetical protein
MPKPADRPQPTVSTQLWFSGFLNRTYALLLSIVKITIHETQALNALRQTVQGHSRLIMFDSIAGPLRVTDGPCNADPHAAD